MPQIFIEWRNKMEKIKIGTLFIDNGKIEIEPEKGITIKQLDSDSLKAITINKGELKTHTYFVHNDKIVWDISADYNL